MDTTAWACPNNPFHHDWNGGLNCRSCEATRTASEAIMSLLAGWTGWDEKRAAALVDQHRLQVLREDNRTSHARVQEQIDQANTELAAIKKDLDSFQAALTGGTR